MAYYDFMKSEKTQKTEDYGKFLDMLDLALMLQGSSGGVTIADIMAKFNASRRTAERMRDAVASYFGADFKEEKDGTQKYFKLRSRRLGALVNFTKEELAALDVASKKLRQDGLDEKADCLDSIFTKLMGRLNSERDLGLVGDVEDLTMSEGIARRPGPKIVIDQAILRPLREAILSFHQVLVTYIRRRTQKTSRLGLIPLGFLYGERNHYLVARHADGWDGKNPHHFILSNIEAVEILPETFDADRDFDLTAHAAQSFGAFHEEPFEVEWLFCPEVADDAARYIFHPSQEVRRNEDGSLTVKFKAGGRWEMAWHLYTWGDKVKVVKPADFWAGDPPPNCWDAVRKSE
jgi:predicted DNA-binding transcriptional regulator YafY